MLFAMYVKTRINMGAIQLGKATAFQESIDRWNLFGHIGRVTTEWIAEGDTQEAASSRYFNLYAAAVNTTNNVMKQLKWLPTNQSGLHDLSIKVATVVEQTDWKQSKKDIWLKFAERLETRN